MKEKSLLNIFCTINSLINNEKTGAINEFSPIDARGTLEREAEAKNSNFMVNMGINRLSM